MLRGDKFIYNKKEYVFLEYEDDILLTIKVINSNNKLEVLTFDTGASIYKLGNTISITGKHLKQKNLWG